jgi:biopolymer transport protein TolQ
MNNTVVKTTELAGSSPAIDVSLFGLIAHADLTVKIVILLLVCASFWSWAIIFDKLIKFTVVKDKTAKFEKSFWSGQLLEQLYERLKRRNDQNPLANVFVAAMHEWNRQNMLTVPPSIEYLASAKDRIFKAMELVRNREIERLEKNLYFLAVVGNNATFLGLFGTVWGIMHSFQSIAASKNTTLAVVAPGIAEALLATAIGLIAAIPASTFYNVLLNRLNSFYNKMEDFSIELGALLSRELDEGKK